MLPSPPPGTLASGTGKSTEETDQDQRVLRKKKRTNEGDDHLHFVQSHQNFSFADAVVRGTHPPQPPTHEPSSDLAMGENDCSVTDEPLPLDTPEWDTDSESEEEEDDELCPNVVLSREEKARLRKPWHLSIIIRLVGKQIGYGLLSRRLLTLWKPSGSLDIIDIGKDYYIAKFGSIFDYRKALTGGPWIVADHYLSVQRWEPDFDPHSSKLDKLIVWVRFPGVAIEYFDLQFLTNLGRKIGKVIKVDATTATATRGKYARVCVEVDLKKPLLSKFRRKGKTHLIHYESLHLLCYDCGRYGHQKEACPHNRTDKAAEEEAKEEGEARDMETPAQYGPWMTVHRQKPKPARRGQYEVSGGTSTNSGKHTDEPRANSSTGHFEFGASSRFGALMGESTVLHDKQKGNDPATGTLPFATPLSSHSDTAKVKTWTKSKKNAKKGGKENLAPNHVSGPHPITQLSKSQLATDLPTPETSHRPDTLKASPVIPLQLHQKFSVSPNPNSERTHMSNVQNSPSLDPNGTSVLTSREGDTHNPSNLHVDMQAVCHEFQTAEPPDMAPMVAISPIPPEQIVLNKMDEPPDGDLEAMVEEHTSSAQDEACAQDVEMESMNMDERYHPQPSC